MHDDLAYHFYYDANSALIRPTSELITSFWQIFPSMWHHYCAVNGRFTSHFLIQLFCGLLGKEVFNIVNTFVFALFIYYFTKFVSYKDSIVSLALLLAAIVFLLPFPGQTMLWLTGSINYFWTTTFSLIIIYYILDSTDITVKPWSLFTLFLCGIFVGWMNESISIGVSGGFFFFLLFNRKVLSNNKISLILGYILGTALIIFSPGTFARAAGGGVNMEYSIIQFFTMRLVVIIQMLIKFPIMLIGLMVVSFQLYKRNYTLLGCIYLFTLLFLCLLGMDGDRVFYGMSIISLILCMAFMREYLIEYVNRYSFLNDFSIILFILCVYPCISAIASARTFRDFNSTIESEILASPSECVIASRELPESNRFVYATSISPDRNTVHNRARAFYYNKSSVQSLPSFLYKQYKEDSFVADLKRVPIIASDGLQLEAFFADSYPYLIIPMPEEYVFHSYSQCQAFFKIQDKNLKLYQKIVRWFLGSLNISSQLMDCYYIEKEGCYYYILPFTRQISRYSIPINLGAAKHDLLLYFENGNS